MPTSKHRPEHDELSDALRHELIAGDVVPSTMPHRLVDWPALYQLPAGALSSLWTEHRDTLSAEATEAGFTPWAAIRFDGVADTPASEAARIAWSRRFHDERGY